MRKLAFLLMLSLSACVKPPVHEQAAVPSREDAVQVAQAGSPSSCDGQVTSAGEQSGLRLADGSFAVWSNLNINIDGSARAYHPLNRSGGALLHLCVGGRVYLPDGSTYNASASNTVCTGRFMDDYERIRAAGWTDTSVGVIDWFGVYATGSVRIGGRTVDNVVPVEQPDGSGFYVSATALYDASYPEADQRRYVEPLAVPASVVSRDLARQGVVQGSAGVAIRADKKIAVPFIVGDIGPRIGEGTPALARQLAGLPIDTRITYEQRYAGIVGESDVLYVFFGGRKLSPPYDMSTVAATTQRAYSAWGGQDRLLSCLDQPAIPRS